MTTLLSFRYIWSTLSLSWFCMGWEVVVCLKSNTMHNHDGMFDCCSLFENYPESKGLFERVNVKDPASPEFGAHVIRVVNGLDIAISLLDDPATLDEELSHLSKQHQDRKGITSSHFDVSMIFKGEDTKRTISFDSSKMFSNRFPYWHVFALVSV